MVPLSALEEAARESRVLREHLSRLASNSACRGITLRPHPLWVLLVRNSLVTDRFPASFSQEWYEQSIRALDGAILDLTGRQADSGLVDIDLLTAPGIDADPGKQQVDLFKQVWPEMWNSAISVLPLHRQDLSNLLVTAVVHDTSNEPGGSPSSLEDLLSLARQGPVPTIIEIRRRAYLELAAADTIRGSITGTAGGFLVDAAGSTTYAVTCAHVTPASTAVVDGHGHSVGTCVHSSALTPLSASTACDPAKLTGPALHKMDAALVELNVAPTPRAACALAAPLRQSQALEVCSPRPAVLGFQIRSLGMSFVLRHPSTKVDCCYASLIELRPGATGLTRGGDSGAWGYANTAHTRWASLHVGSDTFAAFELRAEDVHNWAEKETGATLTIA